MIFSTDPHRVNASLRPFAVAIALVTLCALWPVPTSAESDPKFREHEIIRPDGIHILDGSYVLDVGELHVNVTNHGLIGSQYTQILPYSGAPSGQWPGGSGHEYLWGAGLWIGGRINGKMAVTTGQPERELRPKSNIIDTIYEARNGRVVRPSPSGQIAGRRHPHYQADDDGDGLVDEDFLNGWDDDRDGLVDEDFGQLASQMFTCTMHDNTGLVRELYPDHQPLGVSVVQRAATFEQVDYEDMVVFEYEITNTGYQTVNDLYLGMYVDCDIQTRGDGASAPDDLAGFYQGAVRGSDGLFHRLNVGWMKDAGADPLPGVFGTILLNHDTDPLQYYAPNVLGVNSYQIFATNALGIQDGEPQSDEARYELMSRKQVDNDRRIDQPADLKYMMSSGPFGNLPPGRKISYQIGMVIGTGMDGMLRSALKASQLYRGRYYDIDEDSSSGVDGRERLVCLGDYPPYDTTGAERLYDYRILFVDEACVSSDAVFGMEIINKDDMMPVDGRYCMYVNADNCEECFRIMGRECTEENGLYWPSFYSRRKTGVYGRETHVPWLFPGEYPPVPPNMRIVPGDNQVEVFWDDISEYDPDPDTGQREFESYRVWRVANWIRPVGAVDETGPEARLWGMIGEWDLINTMPGGVSDSPNERTLGRNTGLEAIRYVPACLSNPRYDGLAEAMQEFVDSDVSNQYYQRPPLRSNLGAVIPGREALVPWEHAPTVLDTFFETTERLGATAPVRIVGKRAKSYYHYIDSEVHNGFKTFYSVVASDHLLEWDGEAYQLAGYGVQSDPGNNQQFTTPAPPSQSFEEREREGVNIYVYPNPATREALAEFQKQPGSSTSPTGERVMFNNLPAARNTIRVFTASGDLVKVIDHDGLHTGGAVSWNLMSRNGQEVVSGIYLYSVESSDSRFEPFRGKFVIIR